MTSPARLRYALVSCLMLGLAWLALVAAPAAAQQGLATFERGSLTLVSADGTERAFDIELALTPQQQSQGLMYRQSLAPDAGMLFIYRPTRLVTMWMKNTVIPLDMLFIAEDGEVVKVVERAVPFSLATISSGEPVRAVLEINGGTVKRLEIRPGDRIVHPAFEKGS
jgi:uncharacterized membrane protein (UPF0127 family)